MMSKKYIQRLTSTFILIHCIDKEISLPLLLSPLATDIDCTIYFKRTFTRITTLKVFSIDRY